MINTGFVVSVFEGGCIIHHSGPQRDRSVNYSESAEHINYNEQNKMQMAWKESIVMNEISPQNLIEMKIICTFKMHNIQYITHKSWVNEQDPSIRQIPMGVQLAKEENHFLEKS